MIFDLRIYTAKPGQLAAWVKLYEEHAWPSQQKYLGTPVFWATSEVGVLNQAVHCWAFESQADREERRAKMEADPVWSAYRKLSAERGLLLSQENRILKSTSFSPL